MVFGAAQSNAPFQAIGRSAVNDLCNFSRADKADCLNIRMRANALNDLFAAVNHVEYSVRQTCLVQHLRHAAN